MKKQMCVVMLVISAVSYAQQISAKAPLLVAESSRVDYAGFQQMTEDVKSHRKQRLVKIEQFNKIAKEPNTIILDTRSRANFDGRHIKGALHLNFSEFSDKKLAELIPNKNTRILIYCNNNFKDDAQTMFLKSMPLALNIPTYINLYGYGYKNVYELSDFLSVNDERVQFEGTFLKQ